MHKSAFDKLKVLKDVYLAGMEGIPLAVLEVGSAVVESTHSDVRAMFSEGAWQYRGMDIEAGKNVDVVVKDPLNWVELHDASVDVLVSNQTFEHMPMPWICIQEIARVLKEGGVAFLIAPSAGILHRWPLDCWRIYPDGWQGLADYAQCTAVEIYTQWKPMYYTDGSDKWQDSVLVMQKPKTAGGGSALPVFQNRQAMQAYEQQRKQQAGRYPLKYKRKAVSRHLRAALKELFSTVR